jgi:two-component system sensor histidine kinase and response regulator WspE
MNQEAGLIVVADDDADSRDMIAEGLEQIGYQVIVASDGAELIDRLAAADADNGCLVITDLDMPRVGGLLALDVIARRFPEAIVVVMTGWRDKIVHEEALARGAKVVLTKPFPLKELRRIAARELGSPSA